MVRSGVAVVGAFDLIQSFARSNYDNKKNSTASFIPATVHFPNITNF